MSGKIPSALTAILLIARLAAADGPATANASAGVLLLRNGQVIQGHIERTGDYYTVTAPDEETQIRANKVEFVCRDLRDGYARKKAAIRADDLQQHLQLLLWCERQGLLDCAQEELNAAEGLDHQHPMIAVLRRRLEIEAQQRSEPARPAEKIEPPPSNEQLDQMTRGMPPGAVEFFVQVVQPILLNHYPGARGYALPDNKRLQLMRPPLGESPGRRITQRNLHAVLQCIDWNNPGESPMLKASAGPTAGTAASAFPTRYSSQYQKLAQWVYLVALKPMPAEENGADNASFADLAEGETPPAHVPAARRIPYRPSTSGRAAGGEGNLPASVGRAKDATDSKDNKDAAGDDHRPKQRTASKESDVAPVPRRTQADRAAAQALDNIDPYDPATFNNQANAPREMPTPASRVLNGGARP
jgi:hypothetical protein